MRAAKSYFAALISFGKQEFRRVQRRMPMAALLETRAVWEAQLNRANELVVRRGLRFDLVDHDGRRAAPLVKGSRCRYFLSGEGKQLGVLAAGWRCASNGPIDGSVFSKDHELRAGVCAGSCAFPADGLLETLRKSARGIQYVALYGYGRGNSNASQARGD